MSDHRDDPIPDEPLRRDRLPDDPLPGERPPGEPLPGERLPGEPLRRETYSEEPVLGEPPLGARPADVVEEEVYEVPEDDVVVEEERERPNWLLWVLPALTFLVGLLLGAAFMATRDEDVATTARPTPSPSIVVSPSPSPLPPSPFPSPTPSPVPGRTETATVTVPGPTVTRTVATVPPSCTQGLQRAQQELARTREALDALGQGNTARTQQLLLLMQASQQDVNRFAQQCATG